MISNGREIVLNIKKWDDWDKDLETDINGKNILDIIDNWLNENTVNSNYNLSDASENFAIFEQVHIPLQNKDGRAIDARLYVSGLQKFLKSEYDILYFQDRSAIISSPPSSSERSGEGEGGDEMR